MDNGKDYVYLVEKYENEIKSRYDHLEKRANQFIQNSGYAGRVIINHSMLNIMIIDYFADIDRLKDFHSIGRANKNKITAYTIYWWMRRKPLQVVVDPSNSVETAAVNEKLVYVNEEFATSLIIKDILQIDKKTIKKSEIITKYVQHAFYYLKYRLLDPQGIEWLLATADVGIEIGKLQQSKRSS